jgi:hypothetical protein
MISCVSHDPKPVMDEIGKLYTVKKESVGVPEHYLGANIEKFQLPDGRESWSMSSCQYVQNVEKRLSKVYWHRRERSSKVK